MTEHPERASQPWANSSSRPRSVPGTKCPWPHGDAPRCCSTSPGELAVLPGPGPTDNSRLGQPPPSIPQNTPWKPLQGNLSSPNNKIKRVPVRPVSMEPLPSPGRQTETIMATVTDGLVKPLCGDQHCSPPAVAQPWVAVACPTAPQAQGKQCQPQASYSSLHAQPACTGSHINVS